MQDKGASTDNPQDENMYPRESENKYKTEMCKNWLIYGSCNYSMKCRFAHGREDLRYKAQLNPRYKSKKCNSFHKKGFCPYGARCNFIHQEGVGQRFGYFYSSLLLSPIRTHLQVRQMVQFIVQGVGNIGSIGSGEWGRELGLFIEGYGRVGRRLSAFSVLGGEWGFGGGDHGDSGDSGHSHRILIFRRILHALTPRIRGGGAFPSLYLLVELMLRLEDLIPPVTGDEIPRLFLLLKGRGLGVDITDLEPYVKGVGDGEGEGEGSIIPLSSDSGTPQCEAECLLNSCFLPLEHSDSHAHSYEEEVLTPRSDSTCSGSLYAGDEGLGLGLGLTFTGGVTNRKSTDHILSAHTPPPLGAGADM